MAPAPGSAPAGFGGWRARLLGFAVAVLVHIGLLLVVSTFGASDDTGYALLAYAVSAAIATVLLVIGGIVLLIPAKTRAFGSGVLIGAGLAALCGGGICLNLVVGA